MLFEKKVLEKLPVALDSVVLAVLTAYITFILCLLLGFWGGVDKNIIFDVIGGLAQISTALAFYLAFKQYRKNSAEKRQLELFHEAKSQIDKMLVKIDGIGVGEHTNLKQLDKSMAFLSNLALNFDVLFKEMEEDINKAIVRMHWQDMYFNNLSHVFTSLDITPILKEVPEINDEAIVEAKEYASAKISKNRVPPVFKEYEFFFEVLSYKGIKENVNFKNDLQSVDQFFYHFMDDKKLNDVLYGLLSRIDVRVRAPMLAALHRDFEKNITLY